MNRRMKIIFTISVLLNIVFIGVGAGMLYRFAQEVPIPGQMSPEARHFVARTFQEGREQVKPLIEDVKARRNVVEDIITAEKFDPDAYRKAAGQLLDAREKVSRKRADIMGQALVDLPAVDREKFAKRIVEGLEGNKPRHKGGYHHKMMKDGEKREEEKSKP